MFDGDTLNDMNIFHSGGKAEILYSIILHFLLLLLSIIKFFSLTIF